MSEETLFSLVLLFQWDEQNRSYSVLDFLFSIDYTIIRGVMKNKELFNLMFYPVIPWINPSLIALCSLNEKLLVVSCSISLFLVTLSLLTTVCHVLWQCLLSLTMTLAVGLLFIMNINTCDTSKGSQSTHEIVLATYDIVLGFVSLSGHGPVPEPICWKDTGSSWRRTVTIWPWNCAGTVKSSNAQLVFCSPGCLKETSSDTQKIAQLTCKLLSGNKW